MDEKGVQPMAHRSGTRMLAMFVVGIVTAILTGSLGAWTYAPLVGWATASLFYMSWVWLAVGRLGPEETASHAVREDPSRAASDLLVLAASLASLGAVAIVLIEARHSAEPGKGVLAGLAVAGVVLSWLLVHTLFTLRYASLYYRDGVGGIDFNQEELPRYGDFAYLAFSVGMTFQVSDTALQNHAIRSAVLRHSLLSYVFGSVILATTINLVVGLTG